MGAETKINRETDLFYGVVFISLLTSLGFFFAPWIRISYTALQEFYKALFPVIAVILAVTPSFYVAMHSNSRLVDSSKKLGAKEFLDFRFNRFMVISFILLIMSLVAVVFSYSAPDSLIPGKETVLDLPNRVMFSIIIFLLVNSVVYFYLYGRQVVEIVGSLSE